MADGLTSYQKKKRAELVKVLQTDRPNIAEDKAAKLDNFLRENAHLLEQTQASGGFENSEISIAELKKNTVTGLDSFEKSSSVFDNDDKYDLNQEIREATPTIELERNVMSEKARRQIESEQKAIEENLQDAIIEVGDVALAPITEQVQKIVDERRLEKPPKAKLPRHKIKIKISRGNPFSSVLTTLNNFKEWISEVDEASAQREEFVPIEKEETIAEDIRGLTKIISTVSGEEKITFFGKIRVFVLGTLEIYTSRLFQPVEKRVEYSEAFMDEGQIDEVYSLKLTRQTLVISGMFIGMLCLFALFERITSNLLPFVILREFIFIIPVSIFYFIVYKYHNRIYLNSLYPVSVMIGGVLQIALAGIFIINTYTFSSLLSVIIAALFLYFGISRLDFDFLKISRQISVPDKDKECTSCGKIIPKGENYCHVCDTHVY